MNPEKLVKTFPDISWNVIYSAATPNSATNPFINIISALD